MPSSEKVCFLLGQRIYSIVRIESTSPVFTIHSLVGDSRLRISSADAG